MKKIFGLPLIRILTLSALVWVTPNCYGSTNLWESWEHRINLNKKLDVKNSRLLCGRHEHFAHRRNVNLKGKKYNVLEDEDHYGRGSLNKTKNKPNARDEMQDMRFRDKPDKSGSRKKRGGHFEKRKDKFINEKINTGSNASTYGNEDDNFLKEPEDGYYRREENVDYWEGLIECKELPSNDVHEIQKKPEVSNKDLVNLPVPPNNKDLQVAEHYDYYRIKKCICDKFINLLSKIDIQFQIEFMRYIKAKNYSAEREFLELRSRKDKIFYYFRRHKVFLPLIIQANIFSVFLLLFLSTSFASVAMAIMSIITGQFLLYMSYYYLKGYIRIRKMHRTFKKHGVIMGK
ncbi:hypothetical protein AK88_05324 [Plasmodium fragile]|uniref:Pv-fam-d protein n=1 Tax=Plasmodium fragile TaxID=5857 RepID=A0A0D9QD98_PLAFR|nr:uncharacterized protein AK88_05324 [Plasmodium fragile]KJP85040.1 hypothetical protein AK88_05324 [Plasmodium fragile]